MKLARTIFSAVALGAAAILQAAPVTFQLDLSPQIAGGNFDPSVDSAEVRGSFDGWSGGLVLSPSAADAETYVGVFESDLPAGTVVQHKFVLNKGGTLTWEQDGLGPEGRQNREVTLTGSAQVIPAVTFNNVTIPPSNVRVTFQVNMEIQTIAGNFDPAAHTVEVRGGFNNWTGGFALAPSSTNPNIYVGTTDVFGSPGAAFEYKFVIDQAGTAVWEGNVGPGGFGNRRFELTQGEQSLPVVYFDNATTPPAGDVPVTFTVNMAVQNALGSFNPEVDTVTVAGQFNNWNTTAFQLSNTPENPLIYRGTATVRASTGASVPYKFLINGSTWEAGGDRTFNLQPPSQTLPTAFFSNQTGLSALAIARESSSEVRLSWTSNDNVRLQAAAAITGPWTEVDGTLGSGSAVVPIGSGNRFFRLAAN